MLSPVRLASPVQRVLIQEAINPSNLQNTIKNIQLGEYAPKKVNQLLPLIYLRMRRQGDIFPLVNFEEFKKNLLKTPQKQDA